MSQAKRATDLFHGSGVKVGGSGMAAMSGSLGTWPISPAANPAKPAPSLRRSSRYAAGTSLALGRAYMSTNCAKKNSISPFFTLSRISSRLAMRSSSVGQGPREHTARERARRWRLCTRENGRLCGLLPAEGLFELDHLHGDLDQEPIVLAQVDTRELLNPPKPLAERVRMDVEGLGCRADVPAAAEELLERAQEGGLALPVVFGDAGDGVTVLVTHRRVDRHAQEVLVGPKFLIRHHGGLPADDRRAEEGVLGLLEPGAEARGSLADMGDTHRHGGVESRMDLAELLDQRLLTRHRDAQQAADGVVAPIEEGAPRRRRGNRLLERVVDRGGGEHDVALVEVAAEAGGPPFEVAGHTAPGELLEEVLDQVLLGEPLDQLDLLQRDGGLVRRRAGELDLRRALRCEETEELVVGHERHSDGCRAAAAPELGPEALELDRFR